LLEASHIGTTFKPLITRKNGKTFADKPKAEIGGERSKRPEVGLPGHPHHDAGTTGRDRFAGAD